MISPSPLPSPAGRGSVDDLIIVENYVDRQCIRHVHVMSNAPITSPLAGWGEGTVTLEAGVYHFRSERPHYGMLDVECCVDEKKGFRRFVVWSFEGCKSVKQAMQEAKTEFCRLFGGTPGFAFVKKLPVGAENYMDVNGIMLMEADWMLEKCVAVGGRQF